MPQMARQWLGLTPGPEQPGETWASTGTWCPSGLGKVLASAEKVVGAMGADYRYSNFPPSELIVASLRLPSDLPLIRP